MKKTLFFTIIILMMSSLAFADSIDLSSWSQEGPLGNGNWVVSGDGTNVLQTINGEPTYFVSPTDYIDTTFDGSFGVQTSSDDDFIGFVFGFNGLDDFYLFDWKQKDQAVGAFEGFTLSRIMGTGVDFWQHTNTGSNVDITVLATSYSPTSGWADYVTYEFSLNYTATNINIKIDGSEIFNVAGTYDTGKFGFYNYSQSGVKYQGFEETPPPPPSVPEPSTLLLMGLGLLGLAGYTRKLTRQN